MEMTEHVVTFTLGDCPRRKRWDVVGPLDVFRIALRTVIAAKIIRVESRSVWTDRPVHFVDEGLRRITAQDFATFLSIMTRTSQ